MDYLYDSCLHYPEALALLQKAHVVLPLRNDVSKVVYIWQDDASKEIVTFMSVLSK